MRKRRRAAPSVAAERVSVSTKLADQSAAYTRWGAALTTTFCCVRASGAGITDAMAVTSRS